MKPDTNQHAQRLRALRRVGDYRRLDGLLAMLTLAVLAFYYLLPEARYGLLVMLFIPVCIGGFYTGTVRSACIAGVAAFAVSLSLANGMAPTWPADRALQVLTVVAWATSLGCCAICVSGMSMMQLSAMARLQETHIAERMTDGLTGVMNRLAFEQELQRLAGEARDARTPLSVMIVDVDFFKKFNDCYGHKAGDFVLREVAATIRTAVRERDILARFGGEEFVVLLPDARLNIACGAGERVRQAIEQRRFRHDGATMRLTVSVGIALLEGEETGEQMLERADAALYTSKHSGRNCVHFQKGHEFFPYGASCALYETDHTIPDNLDAIADDGYSEQVTGLPHRRIFHEELKRRVAEANRYKRDLTLMFIKIERYADVIRLGTDAEVMLLSVLAETLRGCLRDCDLGGRTGRSEFAVLLPDTPLEGAQIPARRFAKWIQEAKKPVYRGVELNVGASIGIATVAVGEEVESFILRTQEALEHSALTGTPIALAAPFIVGNSDQPLE